MQAAHPGTKHRCRGFKPKFTHGAEYSTALILGVYLQERGENTLLAVYWHSQMDANGFSMIDEGQFRLQQQMGVPLVEVRGDLDISNADKFEAILNRVMSSVPRGVIVSLVHATYLDSRGIHTLLRFADRLSHNEGQLFVVAPAGTSPRWILHIARVQQLIPMFDSAEDAIASLHPTK